MPHAAGPVTASGGGDGSVRVRAVLAYDGSRYHGWARQPGLPTVEQAVLDALTVLLPAWGIALTCAGRTDAGVHAHGQVVHVDAPPGTDPRRLRSGLNALLPPDIRVRQVTVVPGEFDARFSALWRHYRYRITDEVPDPLTRHFVLPVRGPLDVRAMDAAVQPLIGEHEYLSFCKPRPGATTIRTVQRCSWSRAGDEVVLDIRADAFCHSMVRSIVGASLQVGRGQRAADWPAVLLLRQSRVQAAPVAPALGLVLTEVGYPPDEALAAQSQRSRRMRSAVRTAARPSR